MHRLPAIVLVAVLVSVLAACDEYLDQGDDDAVATPEPTPAVSPVADDAGRSGWRAAGAGRT